MSNPYTKTVKADLYVCLNVPYLHHFNRPAPSHVRKPPKRVASVQIEPLHAIEFTKTVGADYSPPVEGWQAYFVMHAFSSHAEVLHNVTLIDFDIRTVSNEHNIYILQKVTPLDLLAQVADSLGSISGSPLRTHHLYTNQLLRAT